MSQHAIENAQSWFQNIREMVEAYQALDTKYPEPMEEGDGNPDWRTSEELEQRMHDSPLSVQVRSGWHNPGDRQRDDAKPEEYVLLLTTGGPALRIIGELDDYCQPENARLQWQDWGTPWTDVHMSELLLHPPSDITPSRADEILLSFASVFYFGE